LHDKRLNKHIPAATDAHNNGGIVGNGVFYAICAEVAYGELRQPVG
jgi:hypothetical protein